MRTELYTAQKVRRRTVVSFVVFFLLFAAGWVLFSRLYHSQRAENDAQIIPGLRMVAKMNSRIFRKTFSPTHLSKTYPLSAAVKNVRVNGGYGLDGIADTATWKLAVVRGAGDTLRLSLADIKALPKTEEVFDFKCIEGWDQVTHWGGVRFSDFVKFYHLDAQAAAKYIGLVTPDGGYYVGIDRESALHPQTLLCYEMNGKPLPQNQGFPLRLIIPVKYGVKHLKRIGTLYFSNTPPPDYWAEQGYDYYSGL